MTLPSSPSEVPQRRPVVWMALQGALVIALVPTALAVKRKLESPPTPREIAEKFRASHVNTTATATSSREPLFVERASALGVSFVHDNAAHGEFRIPEEMGPGVGLFDFDRDGDLDIFLGGGGELDDPSKAQACALYRNDGGHFVDVSRESGANVLGPAFGITCADYDDDGWTDVYITRLGPNVLLHNRGNGTFEDVSAQAGVNEPSFGASACFFDYDNDGKLDLYVANYIDWKPGVESLCHSPLGVRDYCDPTSYQAPSQDHLFHNLGGGRFEDVTVRAGIDGHRGHGLGVVASDFDGDGKLDLYVANDAVPAKLWHNRGDGTFDESALESGCAYSSRGLAIAGMGVACEDIDNDGFLDLFVTNIRDQTNLVLLNRKGHFDDASTRMGAPTWSMPYTAFGVVVLDADLDGEWDMYVTNGAVNLGNADVKAGNPYAEPDQWARWDGARFVEDAARAGDLPRDVGRGVAAGDLDGDGDCDLVVSNNGGPARVLINQQRGGAWLVVDARRPSGSAEIGARVEARIGTRTWRREIRANSSYLSSNDARAYLGFGNAQKIDELSVTWRDGTKSTRRDVAVNQVLVITRGEEGR